MARDLLADTIVHRVLERVELISGKLSRTGIGDITALKLPSEVIRVNVKGKLILIELASGAAITSSLGMSGWWYPHIDQVSPSVLEHGKSYYNGRTRKISEVLKTAFKHERVRLHTTTGEIASYVDPRNFGNMKIWLTQAHEHPFDNIGLDLLNEYPQLAPVEPWFPIDSQSARRLAEENQQKLEHLQRWRESTVKARRNKRLGDFCLDQSVVSGLGNIYRAETLYLCGLSPHLRLKDLSEEEFFGLLAVGSLVLHMAYRNKGTMMYPVNLFKAVNHASPIHERATARGIKSIDRHLVYGQYADPVGNPVIADKSFGRAMWWCPAVQEPA